MSGIIFFDTEVTVDQEKIIDFGAINDKDEKLHTGRVDLFSALIKETSFISKETVSPAIESFLVSQYSKHVHSHFCIFLNSYSETHHK